MPDLVTALRTIHADRDWWKKVSIGGLLWLFVAGWPIVEGHQIESIDNSQRGFPTPLPLWHNMGDKAVLGLFALVIDFFYFVFPVLIGGIVIFCSTLTIGLARGMEGSAALGLVILLPLLLYILVAWLVGASPVAKQRYVNEGDLDQALSTKLLREILRSPARTIYLRARLLSLPPYLVVGVLAALSLRLFGTTVIGGLVGSWVTLSALVWARLVTIQLYLAATRAVEMRRFEMRRANGTR